MVGLSVNAELKKKYEAMISHLNPPDYNHWEVYRSLPVGKPVPWYLMSNSEQRISEVGRHARLGEDVHCTVILMGSSHPRNKDEEIDVGRAVVGINKFNDDVLRKSPKPSLIHTETNSSITGYNAMATMFVYGIKR